MVKFTTEEHKLLAEFESSVAFRHSSEPSRDKDGNVIPGVPGADKINAVIINTKGKEWCRAEGVSEQDAKDNVMAKAKAAPKPERMSDVIAENQRLRRQLAEAKGESPPENTEPVVTAPMPDSDDPLKFTLSELKAYLEHLNIDFDRRLGLDALRGWAIEHGHLTAPVPG